MIGRFAVDFGVSLPTALNAFLRGYELMYEQELAADNPSPPAGPESIEGK